MDTEKPIFKIVPFEKILSLENSEEIALILITPKQTLCALPATPEIDRHQYLVTALDKNIFDENIRFPEYNCIEIRLCSTQKFAHIYTPCLVTSREFEDLRTIISRLCSSDIDVTTFLTDVDPTKIVSKMKYVDEFDGLAILDYFTKSKKIVEYELPFEERTGLDFEKGNVQL